MATPIVPRSSEMMELVLGALKRLKRPATSNEIDTLVIEQMRASPPGPQSTDADRHEVEFDLSAARSLLRAANLITLQARGLWALTPDGFRALSLPVGGLDSLVAQRAREAHLPALQENAAASAPALPLWQGQLLEAILAMTPDAFERLCQRILRANNFIRVEITGRSGDDGIDGIGIIRVNLVSFHVMFQCKRWREPVGAPALRDFRGALTGRAEKGLFFTTSSFTPAALREARRPGAPPIDLVDGEALCHLLKELRLGVNVQIIEDISVEPSFFALI